MKPYLDQDKKIIGLLTILSGILALACMVVGLIATNYDSEAFANPTKLMEMPEVSTGLLRWFMLLDMFGYYLLLIPVLFFLHRTLEQTTSWASVFTSLGMGYILTGAMGAAILAVTWPELIERYEVASSMMQEVYKGDFQLMTEIVYKGLWNYLEVLAGGIWWIGIGYFMIHHRALKIITIILGASCLIDGLGEIFQLPILAEIGLNVYLLLGIIWPIWIGILLTKNKL